MEKSRIFDGLARDMIIQLPNTSAVSKISECKCTNLTKCMGEHNAYYNRAIPIVILKVHSNTLIFKYSIHKNQIMMM